MGRVTWSMCLQAMEKRSACSAATFKDHECWLHDRHMEDWWSEQSGEVADYAPKGGGMHRVQTGGLVGPQQATTMIVRLMAGLDECIK
eukprot:CAMPEP_0171633262 /NCGR_PEP_ID=MMETSP0990-20121206/25054_1 /TAXON_ID=483369 /ORGANISM="non described non described, Strain CCMP2098" /LENGTH=87 /DNA_ID=CAMNT_0012203857 /DNA_START=16 /DNA_END=279 /DNA_ORIENTATION=-